MRGFYSRVEAAYEYARSLEQDLHRATSLVQHSQHALTQCEASLAASWDQLNEERLDHRAAQEELLFERERHKETMELLEKVFHEAMHSGEIADMLSREVATLREASSSGVTKASSQAPASLTEGSLTDKITSLHTPTALNRRSESASTQLEECARNQDECDASDAVKRQDATTHPNNELSHVSESSSYITGSDRTFKTAPTSSNISGTTEQPRSVRDAAAKASRKSKPVSKMKRTRSPGC